MLSSATQAPPQHPCPAPQQTVPHTVSPDWQTRQSVAFLHTRLAQSVTAGVGHCPLALHVAAAVRRPFAHDCPRPHVVPADLLVVSIQISAPVAHEYDPFLHGLDAVQLSPSRHGEHRPFKQKSLMPQLVPFGADMPVSVQTGAPVAQDSLPVWHLLDGVQEPPSLHVSQPPELVQT
jgi:hypothetical protein